MRRQMLFHRRRIATTRSPATPIGPSGCGGTAPSSLSLLGHNERALLPRRSWNPGPLRSQQWYSYLGDGTLAKSVLEALDWDAKRQVLDDGEHIVRVRHVL